MDFVEIGKKWQKRREEAWTYRVVEDESKKSFYILDMFPYPSGAGLHVWHPKWYIATDVIARKHMLLGEKVLHPMWFDTFGVGTEQYAIAHKMKPQKAAADNIATYKRQLAMFGCTYDRDRQVNTAEPDYFKWTQTIFLKMYNSYFDEEDQKAYNIERLKDKISNWEVKIPRWMSESDFVDSQRLCYMDYKPINRCPTCKTWLSNEDLDADGTCERCGTPVEQKPMKQRVIRITKYADRLLAGLEDLPGRAESVKDQQRNWIGRSEGTEFEMDLDGFDEKISVYTTRVDTVFGMSFVVMAPEHELVEKITTAEYRDPVDDYIDKAKHKTQLERTWLQKEKTWQFTWAYAINPFNNKKVPIYIWDYVLANYGTWVVMAVPAHDERDFDFAKKYNIPIINSILPVDPNFEDYEKIKNCEVCYPEKWIVNNSWEFSGLESNVAIAKMQEWLSEKWIWWKKVNYRLQDRVFSRQRYWWEPIPMIHCPNCGIVPLQESDLPLRLPDVENYEPTGTEEWPLANIPEWINCKCPHCGADAKRESNTMPGRAWSSRYWIRYMDPHNDNQLVDPEKEKFWHPVDMYVWWAEHINRHLIYARFWNKFLKDMWITSVEEPFKNYQSVWLIMAEDGRKMSKRRWNVVNPDDIVNEYGADTLRMYEMFMGPFDQAVSRNTNGVKWVKKLLDRVCNLWPKVDENHEDDKKILMTLHQTIKKVDEDISNRFGFNTAIAQMMILVNELTWVEKISKKTFETLIILLAPFAPHLAEEFREKLWNEFSIFDGKPRPEAEEKYLVQDTITMAVQVNGKVRWTIEVSKTATQDEVMEIVKNDEKISRNLVWEIKKVIYIPWKICNIVL